MGQLSLERGKLIGWEDGIYMFVFIVRLLRSRDSRANSETIDIGSLWDQPVNGQYPVGT